MNAYSFPENFVISDSAKNLITQILVTDPSKRPSLDQILIHDFFNQGTSIPKLLPASTLACTPSLSYIRTFMPDAGDNGICNKPCTPTKLKDLPSGSGDKKNEQKKQNNDTENEDTDTNKSDKSLKGPDT